MPHNKQNSFCRNKLLGIFIPYFIVIKPFDNIYFSLRRKSFIIVQICSSYNRNINLYRSTTVMCKCKQSFIYKTVAQPFVFRILNNRKVNALFYNAIKNVCLLNFLYLELSLIIRIFICGYCKYRNALIKRFGNTGKIVTNCSSRCTHTCNGYIFLQCNTHCKICRTSLIYYGKTRKVFIRFNRMN